jgi:hypothetical protein
MDISTVNNKDGTTTYFVYSPDSFTIEAVSISDVKNLLTQIDQDKSALAGEIQDGMATVQAFASHLDERWNVDNTQRAGLQRQDHADRNQRHANRQEQAADTSMQQQEQNIEVDQTEWLNRGQ